VPDRLTWCEVSQGALAGNVAEFRRLVGPACRLGVVVKANAYGHGLVNASRAFIAGGADMLLVNDLWEAGRLREAGIGVPILVLGRVLPEQARLVVALGVSVIVYDEGLLRAIDEAARASGQVVEVHLKVETGTNRQGIYGEELLRLAEVARGLSGVKLRGVSTHFADIEDTTDHTFARSQLAAFEDAVQRLEAAHHTRLLRHCANSAATILWPEAHMDMVRLGIAAYGMWPSKETFVAAALTHRHRLELTPALTWKTVVAQVKTVPAGAFVGYGRTYRTTHASRIAVLPVGYYDGYDRGLFGAHVLVKGQRAPVRGRICMNMTMVDVTDINGVAPGDEVVLLGRSQEEVVTAEQMAAWAGTINYEITTRICESVPRVVVP